MDDLINTITFLISQTQANMWLILSIIALLWIIQFINCIVGYRLNYLGIIPRHLFGIPGIVLCPFLHADFNHLFFNSIPLFLLGDFMLIYGWPLFIHATIAIVLISGILTWLFARKAIHIGASSLITGYWSYLVVNMYHQGGAMATILGIITIYYFAGIFLGIFITRRGVSWEGHLFGFIAGIVTYYGLPFLQIFATNPGPS